MRPVPAAAAAAPRKNGVTSDAMPNTRPHARCHDPGPACAKANPDPRKTIPRPARSSGRYRPTPMADTADGKAASNPARTKISQTWFTSHTGPIASATSAR